jgi:hypothetical protein
MASALLACVMVAGYLGLLPALKRLEPKPSWPSQPGTVLGAVGAVQLDRVVVVGPPVKKPRPAIHKVHVKPRTSPATLASSSSSNSQVRAEPAVPNQTFEPGSLAATPPPPDPTCQGEGC